MIQDRQLTRTLRDELSLQTRHCRLLEAQQRALMACDREHFRQLQEEYPALLEQMQAQAEAREKALRDEDGSEHSVSALIEALPEKRRLALIALRTDLRRTLERAQALCRRNELLIQNELNYIAFALDLFVEAGRRADVSYGGSGSTRRRRLLDRRA